MSPCSKKVPSLTPFLETGDTKFAHTVCTVGVCESEWMDSIEDLKLLDDSSSEM